MTIRYKSVVNFRMGTAVETNVYSQGLCEELTDKRGVQPTALKC